MVFPMFRISGFTCHIDESTWFPSELVHILVLPGRLFRPLDDCFWKYLFEYPFMTQVNSSVVASSFEMLSILPAIKWVHTQINQMFISSADQGKDNTSFCPYWYKSGLLPTLNIIKLLHIHNKFKDWLTPLIYISASPCIMMRFGIAS